jgi:RNA recognition motif-containing protein
MGKSKKQDTPKEQKSDAESSSSLDEAPTKKVEKKPATPAKWLPKQVFVSGLPYETTEEVLRAFFGEIASEIG